VLELFSRKDVTGWSDGVVTLFYDTHVYGLGFYAEPQNIGRGLTEEEYQAIRKEMAKALQSEKCRKFVDALISHNTRRRYDSAEEFLDYSDNVFKNSGIFFGGQIGGLRRENPSDYPKILLGPEYPLKFNLLGFAETLFHELIHGPTIGSDNEMSRELRDLGIIPLDRNGKPLNTPTGENHDYSTYVDTAVKNACFPQLRN